MTKRQVRAISLLSGGLDSQLAVCVLASQGIEVTGITFVTPFFGEKNAVTAARNLGIELKVLDITDDHLRMVKNPPHGFGKHMNPCIDCHGMMVRKAGEIAEKEGFDLISTGEVLGERPMSQNRQSLDVVANLSGYADILLRPLSAKLLLPTRPEQEGLVVRDELMAIEGRSRKPQMELAKKYGITEFVQPAGGCLLTDPNFSVRLKELFSRDANASVDDVKLLKLGRHFRLPSGAKVVVGRDEKDNENVLGFAKGKGELIETLVAPGPVVYLSGSHDASDLQVAAALCASYSDHGGKTVELQVTSANGEERMTVSPQDRADFTSFKI